MFFFICFSTTSAGVEFSRPALGPHDESRETGYQLLFLFSSLAVHGQLEYIERDAGVMGLFIAHTVVERADPNITEDQSIKLYIHLRGVSGAGRGFALCP